MSGQVVYRPRDVDVKRIPHPGICPACGVLCQDTGGCIHFVGHIADLTCIPLSKRPPSPNIRRTAIGGSRLGSPAASGWYVYDLPIRRDPRPT